MTILTQKGEEAPPIPLFFTISTQYPLVCCCFNTKRWENSFYPLIRCQKMWRPHLFSCLLSFQPQEIDSSPLISLVHCHFNAKRWIAPNPLIYHHFDTRRLGGHSHLDPIPTPCSSIPESEKTPSIFSFAAISMLEGAEAPLTCLTHSLPPSFMFF